MQALFNGLAKRKELLVVNAWLQTLQDGGPRHKFLVLCGPSGLGKSLYVASLAGRPNAFFECDCSNNDHPNLRTLDRSEVKLVLFDECKATIVLRNKRLFQGHQLAATMVVSPTNRDSYRVCLHGIGLVIASNTWQDELKQMKNQEVCWLDANSVVVEVTSPLYSD